MSITLRFRHPKGGELLELCVEPECLFGLLPFYIEQLIDIPAEEIQLLSGFPPQVLPSIDPSTPIKEFFRDGDSLIVQRCLKEGASVGVRRGRTDGVYVPPCDERGCFVRRTMPSDNSCLFHAVAYVLEGKSRTGGPRLREEVAEVVAANPLKFNKSLLGMANQQYVSWIRNPGTWGGAIELMILSFVKQTEIVALDIESCRMESFGRGEGYATKAFLVYTGNHYDAMAMTRSQSGVTTADSPESMDQVLFNPRDERAQNAAIAFVEKARKERQSV